MALIWMKKVKPRMKWLNITNDHGWTTHTLQKQEQKIKNVVLCQRVMAVRLVMEGHLGKKVTSMDNLRLLVKRFILSFFIQRRCGSIPCSTGNCFKSWSSGKGKNSCWPKSQAELGHRFAMEYSDSSIVYLPTLQGNHILWRDVEIFVSNETVLYSANVSLGKRLCWTTSRVWKADEFDKKTNHSRFHAFVCR